MEITAESCLETGQLFFYQSGKKSSPLGDKSGYLFRLNKILESLRIYSLFYTAAEKTSQHKPRLMPDFIFRLPFVICCGNFKKASCGIFFTAVIQ